MTTEKPAAPLSTSDGARCYIAHFFAREMRRHDFATYIATELAADFACALAQYLGARQPGAQEPVAWRYHAEGDATKWYYSDTASLLGLYQPLYAAPPAQGINLAARPMDTAPRDGTLVRLLVDFDENAIEDSISATWTIGACNDDNVSEGARIGWQFAGWCWTHDHFTEGTGTPVGWLPLIDQRDAGHPSDLEGAK